MKREVQKISKTIKRFSAVMLVAFSATFVSCSDDDDKGSAQNLITEHNLAGSYRVQIASSFMGSVPMAGGEHTAIFTDEGNGVLSVQFSGFNVPPMPFVMAVDASFTLSRSGQNLVVHNVSGQSFFDANVPPGQTINPGNLPPGLTLPDGALQNGLHSNGASVISGQYDTTTNQFNLQLDPAVGLPVLINITTMEKLN